MSEDNVVLTFDGDFKAFDGDKKKPIVDMDIDASASEDLLEIEFDDVLNDTQYYAQIPLEGPIEDEMALEILKIKPTEVTHIDLINQLKDAYPCSDNDNLDYVSNFKLTKNNIPTKKRKSQNDANPSQAVLPPKNLER